MTRRTRQISLAWTLGILVVGAVGATSDQQSFDKFLVDYEAIRVALLNDTMQDIEHHAAALEQNAAIRLEHLTTHGHESAAEDAAMFESALEEIVVAASALSVAEDLSSARSAMFGLTKPMVKFRMIVADESTLVAYCPMAKKSWLQESGELGNPYFGQQMPTCGEVVSD